MVDVRSEHVWPLLVLQHFLRQRLRLVRVEHWRPDERITSRFVSFFPPLLEDPAEVVQLAGPAERIIIAAAECVPDASAERLPLGDLERLIARHRAIVEELSVWRERLVKVHLDPIDVWRLAKVKQTVD